MHKSVEVVLDWARLHPGAEPREHKSSSNEQEKAESRAARRLRDLRAKESDGKLTYQETSQLTEVRFLEHYLLGYITLLCRFKLDHLHYEYHASNPMIRHVNTKITSEEVL